MEYLTLEDGSVMYPTDDMEVKCQTHGIVTTYGNLDAIQRLALSEGIDTTEDLPCIFVR